MSSSTPGEKLVARVQHHVAEHTPNYVYDEGPDTWRIQCEGRDCTFLKVGCQSWYRMMEAWVQHTSEVLATEMLGVMEEAVRLGKVDAFQDLEEWLDDLFMDRGKYENRLGPAVAANIVRRTRTEMSRLEDSWDET